MNENFEQDYSTRNIEIKKFIEKRKKCTIFVARNWGVLGFSYIFN
jgi:hypothetical protein